MKPETGGNDGQQSFERDQRIQQRNDEYDIDELKEELADVYSYVLMMADADTTSWRRIKFQDRNKGLLVRKERWDSDMTTTEKQFEINKVWIDDVYKVLRQSLVDVDKALKGVDFYTRTLGLDKSQVEGDYLCRLLDADLNMFISWLGLLKDGYSKEWHEMAAGMLPVLPEYERQMANVEILKSKVKDFVDTYFPSELSMVAMANYYGAEYKKSQGQPVDPVKDYALTRLYFRLLNMIVDTAAGLDGVRNEKMESEAGRYIKMLDDKLFEAYGVRLNDREYDTDEAAGGDVPPFRPLC